MSRAVHLAAIQTAPVLGNTSKNLEKCVELLHEAANLGAQIAIFPECSLTGYTFETRAAVEAVAEEATGPSLETMSAVCRQHEIVCVVGFVERLNGAVYNSAAVLSPRGILAVYRKTHLPLLGLDRFVDPGGTLCDPIRVSDVRAGVLICYDMRFPEPARILAIQGVDLILQPTNLAQGGEAQLDILLPARACENRVFLVSANRPGRDGTFQFLGRSQIIAPTGAVIAEASGDREEIIHALVDLDDAADKDIVITPGVHELHLFSDRRPDLYGPLGA